MTPTDNEEPDADAIHPATESQIASFERRIGKLLPEDYRAYLLSVNGGHPEPSMYHGEVMDIYVQWIFSLLDDEEDGLVWEWRTAHLPETFKGVLLPFATVNGGDRLYLSLVNGEVFFYSHEEESFTLIEDSFTSILDKLGNDDASDET